MPIMDHCVRTINILPLLCVLCCLWSLVVCDDFYEMFGISKNADDREIRRAFKKLAVKLHPDKNQDDPKAHDKFVKVNRAYEVLKDEELRKKYDLYGEEGLKDDFGGGQNYQSWHFYQNNFGIYDEDPEIITLSASDFEQSVENSQIYWFINFYSTQCGHCHELAPTWRRIARELEGVIRIGAINCQDSWNLCRSQGIFGYPALVFYPKRIQYEGGRDEESLIQFVMENLPTSVTKLNEHNFEHVIKAHRDQKLQKPWLIDFCESEDTECLSDFSRNKLSAMMDGLLIVARINCNVQQNLCKKFGLKAGIAYFKSVTAVSQFDHSELFDSFDAKELAFLILAKLSDCKKFNGDTFEELQEKITTGQENPWLIKFIDKNTVPDLELRKLPAFLRDIKCGQINCSEERAWCATLNVAKFPTFAVFKRTGGYEMHYGRATAPDVAAFAQAAAETNLRVINSEDLHNIMTSPQETWFIDFFTPWCPPCMKLLPQFRKAAKVLGDQGINFGIVDCTLSATLCQSVNVNQYPTTILYNQSHPHISIGYHGLDEILDFVEDIRNPTVVVMDGEFFVENVLNRADSRIWIVDFFAPWCGPCQEFAPEYRKLSKMLMEMKNIGFGTVDCTLYPGLCQENHIHSYPTIRMYLQTRDRFIDYNHWARDAHSVRQWIVAQLPSNVVDLTTDDFFGRVLNDKIPWLVDFFAPWCGHCHQFAPEFEIVASKLKGKVNCGKINCDMHPRACESAGVRAYPSVKLYRGVSSEQALTQNAFGDQDISSQNAVRIISYLTETLKLHLNKGKQHDEL